MEGLQVAVIIVLILLAMWFFGMIQVQSPSVNVAAAPAPPSETNTQASDQGQGKYQHLTELLQSTPKWLYFDEKTRQRRSITLQIQPDSKSLVMSADVMEKPVTLSYGPAVGNSDTMILLDSAKGGPDKYAVYVMYVNDRQLIIEEKTDGKITFQQKLGV